MIKVILTKGLPGSGKSTWAKSLVDNDPNTYKRINKDDLRAMFDNAKFTRSMEKFIIKVRNQLILMAIAEGKHVIIDDTNLAPKHETVIRELVKGKAEVIIQDFTHVPVETCIERDLKRQKSVGETVIRQLWEQYLHKPQPLVINPDLPHAIICDLDGTLALLNGRNPFDAANCDKDLLNEPVASILKGRTVILVSGRDDKYRKPTLRFLEQHNIVYEMLLMRKNKDQRKDSIVKREIFEKHIRPNYNIDFVLDDRNQVVAMWREMGLTCLQVAYGNF
jgi:predicted kinase